jgi:hypothetical protein
VRVEDVHQVQGGLRSRWTSVLGTERGTGVRVDYRCTGATHGERYAWEQDIEGTPFEKILRSAALEINLQGRSGGTVVTLVGSERLRGLSRLGSPMMRRAIAKRLNEALDGIERALT